MYSSMNDQIPKPSNGATNNTTIVSILKTCVFLW
ncbi:hypothetical protein AHF37_10509, partial [Paragonimus kellicotti]